MNTMDGTETVLHAHEPHVNGEWKSCERQSPALHR